jgi:hypothetical protein
MQGASSVENITIVDGVIDARGSDGAGIGAGYGDHGASNVRWLRILRGEINAAGLNGAGIGAGYGKTADSRSGVTEISIASGTIVASATYAAGIGIGYAADGFSYVDRLSIAQGTITTSGWVGIGAAETTLGGTGHLLTLDCTPTEPWCIVGDNLTIADVPLTASTSSPTFISPISGSAMHLSDLVGQYRVRSDADQFANITAIHIGNLAVEGTGVEQLTFTAKAYSRTVEIHLGLVKGVIVALAHAGSFSVVLGGRPLCHGDQPEFVIGDGVGYFQQVSPCRDSGGGGLARLSTEAIAGIGVGAVVTLIAIVIIAVAIRRRRHDSTIRSDVILDSASGAGVPGSSYTAVAVVT